MEKPTGVIQKIIESLQQVNALDVYSPIEKDIILHNLRAAYMIFLNLPIAENSTENRVERLFVEENPTTETSVAEQEPETPISESVEVIEETSTPETSVEVIEEIPIPETIELIEEIPTPETSVEVIEEIPTPETSVEVIEETPTPETSVEVIEEIPTPETSVEVIEEIPIPETIELIEEIPTPETSVAGQDIETTPDDILEFIPDAKPQTSMFFDETMIPKPEKKSLNDLLTEKKDDNSIGNMFQQYPIPDLTKAIAINEKFSFIKELFHNSGVDFSNAIQKLNECENIDSAFLLMEELKHQYLWDTTSSAYLSLCDLVRRRFL